jgi:hypothetical protein
VSYNEKPLTEANEGRTAGEWTTSTSFDDDDGSERGILIESQEDEVAAITFTRGSRLQDVANAAFIAACTDPETGVAAALAEIGRLRERLARFEALAAEVETLRGRRAHNAEQAKFDADYHGVRNDTWPGHVRDRERVRDAEAALCSAVLPLFPEEKR